MNQFFIKTTVRNKAKNGLQNAIHELLDTHDCTLVRAEDLRLWIIHRTNEIVHLNREYNRCAPEEFQTWKSERNNLGAKACDSYHLAIWEVKA